MKHTNLTKCLLAILVLASSVANAEDQYPAANFEPKVVYQDESVAKGAESTATSKPSSSTTSSSSDSQYPASDFQPKVVYSDSDYKHTTAAASSSSSATSSSSQGSSSSESSVSAAPAPAQSDSSMGYLYGLVALAVGGFVFFKKGAGKSSSPAKSSTVNYASRSGAVTGVARYVMRISGTGVSRYIDKNTKAAASSAPTSGVAKYLASRSSESKAESNQSATGVEKYLRNKG